LYSFQYSKVISTIMFGALLAGLQSVILAVPAEAKSCQLHARTAGAHSHWRLTEDAGAKRCAVRAGRKAPARNQAALEEAHAELGEIAAQPGVGETAAPAEVSEAATHAQVRQALDEQQPGAPHCVAAAGQPFRRGAWELGIDRASGHRCWRLVATIKPHARIASRAKSFHVRKPAAPSPRLAAMTAGPVAAPAAAEGYRPSQPPEVLTGSLAKPSETQPVNLGQSPVSTADAISRPSEVDRVELPRFDPRADPTADPGSIGTSAALVASRADDAKMSAGSMLEHAAAFMPVRGRPAIFLIVFFSVLATISALYALVTGSLKLLRSHRRLQSASAIGVMAPRYLTHWRTESTDDHV